MVVEFLAILVATGKCNDLTIVVELCFAIHINGNIIYSETLFFHLLQMPLIGNSITRFPISSQCNTIHIICSTVLSILMILDINECLSDVNPCSNSRCVNTVGSFFCTCNDGFIKSNGSQTVCVDVDECDLGLDDCTQLCSNTEGRYECSCQEGYTLDADGSNCTIIPSLGNKYSLNINASVK